MSQRRFVLGAIPTILFIVGGSFALANVRKGRYEVQQERDRQLAKAVTQREKFDIDAELELLKKRQEFDRFEIVRIKRPPGYEQ